ncbi:polysaccharide biosynthesis tyrosine autokinase [Streptomyces sp. NPDC051913]|uniref:polysaccharide biosynthesis tyrosine autokinase n=1 Tax=Streptomyces sp. NPDC051913 TaxID=3365676 RepID=UPI0037D0F549
MDLHAYIETLRRRWRFVTVCVLLGLAAAVAVTALMPRTYTATAQLFVATSDEDSGNAYQGGLFTQERVKSYTRIVTSPAVLDEVISDLGLNTTPGRLAEKIDAQAPLDTTLVDIRVSDGSARQAQAIADATALQFTKYIAAIEGSAVGAPPLVKASVVGGSEPPTSPASPRPALNIAIGLLVGAVAGVAGAVLRESLDTTIRSVDDLRGPLGLTVLGAIPAPDRRRPDVPGTTGRTEDLAQVRTRLRFTTEGGVPDSILVAGARPEEGRTQTAIDLATSVAHTGRRVVLLEADLRRPRVAAELGLRDGPGLADVLAHGTPLYQALQSVDGSGVRVLTAGTVQADPGTLLSSPDLARLMRALDSDADLIVVDSPPLLAFADAAVLAAVTDGALFVARAGRTRRADAERALDALAAVHARVLGAVLTGARADGLADWQPPSAPDRATEGAKDRPSAEVVRS